jgi:hypothetical protein
MPSDSLAKREKRKFHAPGRLLDLAVKAIGPLMFVAQMRLETFRCGATWCVGILECIIGALLFLVIPVEDGDNGIVCPEQANWT